jgi:hypothetical protein
VKRIPYFELATNIEKGVRPAVSAYRLALLMMHLSDTLEEADKVAARVLAQFAVKPDESAWLMASTETGLRVLSKGFQKRGATAKRS